MFVGTSKKVSKAALDRYAQVLIPIMASFPRHVPTLKATMPAMHLVAQEVGVKLITDRMANEWCRTEAMSLRAMMSYIRRLVKKNGVGGRSALHWLRRE